MDGVCKPGGKLQKLYIVEMVIIFGLKTMENISKLTLDHYNQRAVDFWEGTREHDVRQNIAALLQHIESTPPFTLL